MATYETILEATVKAGVEHFGGFPPGSMIAFAGKAIPDGWLLCNGALVSRTTYAKLFAAIGTAWGAGNGSTTFKLPDADGRVMQGVTDASKVGQYLEAGLPNITANFRFAAACDQPASGAIRDAGSDRRDGNARATGNNPTEKNLNASWASYIYSKSDSVQPPAIQTLIIIKV